jgi:hypothetical protein
LVDIADDHVDGGLAVVGAGEASKGRDRSEAEEGDDANDCEEFKEGEGFLRMRLGCFLISLYGSLVELVICFM